MLPLDGINVLDFSTLLPGPMAGLLLAEAGADVIKIERPGGGDEMRSYEPKLGTDSANFVLLNRGKKSIAIDLKAPDAIARLTPLIEHADVLIEQFRPGVMQRLGLGYEALRRINARLIYCSVTGFGQTGPRRNMAAHDLNYLALTGLLSLSSDADGKPSMPHTPIADIAAGAYPAVMNILLALLQREKTGEGLYLDISMTDNLFILSYWALGSGFTGGTWPKAGAALTNGGSPRYNIYRTADHGYVSAGPIEQRFWDIFCDTIQLDESLRDDGIDPQSTIRGVAARIAMYNTTHWREAFTAKDTCCAIVLSLEEAVSEPHAVARGLFSRRASAGMRSIPAIPTPLVPPLRDATITRTAPCLGENNALLTPAP